MTTATFASPTRTITQTAHDMILLRDPSPTTQPTTEFKTELAVWSDKARRGLHMAHRVLKLWYL